MNEYHPGGCSISDLIWFLKQFPLRTEVFIEDQRNVLISLPITELRFTTRISDSKDDAPAIVLGVKR